MEEMLKRCSTFSREREGRSTRPSSLSAVPRPTKAEIKLFTTCAHGQHVHAPDRPCGRHSVATRDNLDSVSIFDGPSLQCDGPSLQRRSASLWSVARRGYESSFRNLSPLTHWLWGRKQRRMMTTSRRATHSLGTVFTVLIGSVPWDTLLGHLSLVITRDLSCPTRTRCSPSPREAGCP